MDKTASVWPIRALSTSTATAGQAEAGSLKTSAKFCFEMASIELEKKKRAGKKKRILLCLLNTKSLQVNFEVEAKVLRYK